MSEPLRGQRQPVFGTILCSVVIGIGDLIGEATAKQELTGRRVREPIAGHRRRDDGSSLIRLRENLNHIERNLALGRFPRVSVS